MLITPAIAAILSFLFIVLSLNVIRLRLAQKTALGSGGNNQLAASIRAQANFAEYVPLALILLYFVETIVMSPFVVLVCGVALMAARLLHPIGMLYPKRWMIFRQFGTLMTFAVLLVLSLRTLYWYVPLSV